MKKRRPCTGSQSHSPKNSPSPLHNQSIPIKSKSHHELKRRRQQRGNARQKSFDYVDNISVKKEVFGSLESLFNLKKPFTLPDIHSPLLIDFQSGEGRTGSSTSESQSPHSQRHLVPSSHLQPFSHSTELEPNIFRQPYELSEFDFKQDAKKTDLEEIVEDEEAFLPESHESIKSLSVTLSDSERKMADEENLEAAGDNVPEVEETPESEEIPEVGDIPEVEEMSEEEEILEVEEIPDENQGVDKTEALKVQEEDELLPPQHSLPTNVGKGIPVKPGKNRDSTMSGLPITDTAMIIEMNDAYERCIEIGEEIEQLRKEMSELANKADFRKEDTVLLSEKQDTVNMKLAELDEITRKIQRMIGLSDPSSRTFAKMFDMLPYPHHEKKGSSGTSNSLHEEEQNEKLSAEDVRDKQETDVEEDDHFDMPQIEYPEDKLPRVIICGNTEENIPQIVVADSQRKRRGTNLENLTGKLSESLIMQEKLVKENAKLEGGKYKLEEALLEKDNAVDCLQRKVCGLQAEMRIVVKENTELSRQVACLNQKIATPSCCYSCPGGSPSSPLSTPALPTYSYSNSAHPDDSSCHCKSCLQENIGDTLPLASKRNLESKCLTVPGTPRLAGGGSAGNYFSLENNVLRGDMSCGSPKCTKDLSSPRPPSRGACPAELENNINLYDQNTKHLEEQLGCIENEVRTMQMELVNVQRERNQLDQQRKLLKCTGPCAPCSCNSALGAEPASRVFQPQNMCPPCPPGPQSGMNVPMPMKVPMKFLDCRSNKQRIDESSRYELFDLCNPCRISNRRS